MNDEPKDQEFEKLRQLLELKRHEVPPPGYFEDFSAGVIARIEAEDARPAPSWWRRLLPGIDTSPVMLGAYGVIVGSLVIAGVQLLPSGTAPQGSEGGPQLSATETAQPAATPEAATDLIPETRPVVADLGVDQPETAPLKTLGNEAEHVARSAPTGMFDPPSIHNTSRVERVSFPANQ